MPWDNRVEEVEKSAEKSEPVEERRSNGWRTRRRPIEVESRGFDCWASRGPSGEGGVACQVAPPGHKLGQPQLFAHSKEFL